MALDDQSGASRLRWLQSLARHLHRLTVLWCLIMLGVLLVAQCAVVLLRYGFDTGFLELQDLVRYCFASLVIMALPAALVHDEHVRVDVWRERQSARWRWRIDLLATVLLLLPLFLMGAWLAMPELVYAWHIREGAQETGGLGGVYLLKTLWPASCLLMTVQGLARLTAPSE